MINIVSSYLHCQEVDEDWVYETLYYLDQLVEKAKCTNYMSKQVVCNGVNSNGRKGSHNSFQQMSFEDKNALLEVIVR